MDAQLFNQYACRPDDIDPRDHNAYDALGLGKVNLGELPNVVNLSPMFPVANNQGSLGSCTAEAATDAMEFPLFMQRGDWRDHSRLFLWYNTRGNTETNSGASIRTVCKYIANTGVCETVLWPYTSDPYTIPTQLAYDNAASFRASDYSKVLLPTVAKLHAVLAQGWPIVFGMPIRGGLVTEQRYGNAWAVLPPIWATVTGGHCMLIVGYDRHDGSLIVRNSWGTYWGDSGYAKFDADTVVKQGWDFWVIRAVTDGKPVPAPTPTPKKWCKCL